jgi:uncharacterized membrane protein YqjE
MEPADEVHPGLLHSLRRLGRAALAILENRAEILLVEFEEERCRAVRALVLVVGAAVLGLMAVLFGTLAVVMACEPASRLRVLAGFSLLYLGATAVVLWKLRTEMREWRSFSATLAELKKDKACLEEPH